MTSSPCSLKRVGLFSKACGRRGSGPEPGGTALRVHSLETRPQRARGLAHLPCAEHTAGPPASGAWGSSGGGGLSPTLSPSAPGNPGGWDQGHRWGEGPGCGSGLPYCGPRGPHRWKGDGLSLTRTCRRTAARMSPVLLRCRDRGTQAGPRVGAAFASKK